MGFGTHPPKRGGDGSTESGHIFWDDVGQVTLFGVIPDQFCRVDFRRIRGQPCHFKPVGVFGLQHAYSFAMHTVAIQHQMNLCRTCRCRWVRNPITSSEWMFSAWI